MINVRQPEREVQVMKQNKKSEFIRVIIISALVMGLFSVMFIAANNWVLSSTIGNIDAVPLITTFVNIPSEAIPPEDFKEPLITVYEVSSEWFTSNSNALSAEAAAHLGAQYIWEVFGESIDGKTIEMFYIALPFPFAEYWSGSVVESKRDPKNHHESLFEFTINAFSGRRVDISRNALDLFGENDPSLTIEELIEIREYYEVSFETYKVREYEQIAIRYAENHFSNSTITSINFISVDPVRFKRDDNGSVVATDYVITFVVSDDAYREIELVIAMDSKLLWRINMPQVIECYLKCGYIL